MEHIARITGIMCFLIIIVSFLNSLGSFSSTEKVIKFVTAIIIVAVLLRIISHADLELKYDNQFGSNIYADNTEYLKKAVIEQTKIELEETIKSRLDEKNISYNSVSLHILEQNSNLYVSEILIDCDMEYENTVKECLGDIVSQETVISTGE